MRLFYVLLLLAACDDSAIAPETDVPATETATETETEIETEIQAPEPTFQEIAMVSGLVHSQWDAPDPWNAVCYFTEVHSGAVSVADYDDDGDHDIFQAVLHGPDRLYRNRGDGTFDEVAAAAGIDVGGMPGGAGWADLDGDGDLDLVVTYLDEHLLRAWMNQGDGTFVEEAQARGLVAPTQQMLDCGLAWSVSFADPDRDGDLDLFVASWNVPSLHFGDGLPSMYFVNDGTGHFEDHTAQAGLVPSEPEGEDGPRRNHAFTASWGDLDGDGWPDLALASDFRSNTMFLNNRDGTFTEVGEDATIRRVENGMGSVLVDWDDDGDLDWWVTSIWDDRPEHGDKWGMGGNHLYLNSGDGTFEEVAADLGIANGGWAWGSDAFDPDNDGDIDLILTNGHWMPEGARYLAEPFTDDPTMLYVQEGGVFVDRAADLGIDDVAQGRGLQVLDVDNDGAQDVIIARWQDTPLLYRNALNPGNHWWRLSLRDQTTANTRGIGARVAVQAKEDGPVRHFLLHANATFLGHSPGEVHVGLGAHDGPLHSVRIQWPDGKTPLSLTNVVIDEHRVVERK